jgi:hypothetical protein
LGQIEKSYSKDIDEKPDVRQAVTAVRLALEAKVLPERPLPAICSAAADAV